MIQNYRHTVSGEFTYMLSFEQCKKHSISYLQKNFYLKIVQHQSLLMFLDFVLVHFSPFV